MSCAKRQFHQRLRIPRRATTKIRTTTGRKTTFPTFTLPIVVRG